MGKPVTFLAVARRFVVHLHAQIGYATVPVLKKIGHDSSRCFSIIGGNIGKFTAGEITAADKDEGTSFLHQAKQLTLLRLMAQQDGAIGQLQPVDAILIDRTLPILLSSTCEEEQVIVQGGRFFFDAYQERIVEVL